MPISNKFIEGEIVICERDEHPSNALNPMLITEEGISINVRPEHSLKAYFSIVFNDD